MKSKSRIFVAASVAVAGGVALGAATLGQSAVGQAAVGQVAGPGALQLADAAKMAAVKERQELMKSVGGNMRTVTEFLKESKGTMAEAEAAAAMIGELAGRIPSAFETEATLDEMDAVGKNRGKPEIWLNWDGFVEKAGTLKERSGALVVAFQGGDSSAVEAAFAAMGRDGCGGCHDDFRGPQVD